MFNWNGVFSSSIVFNSLSVFFVSTVGFTIAHKLGAKVTEANPEEIKREDDVLLEAVAFSQSILFVLLSLMQSEDKLREALLSGIVLTTIAFYTLRAWAKIKDSPKYRYYSMFVFAFLSGNTVSSVLKLYFNTPDDFILTMSTIYLTVAANLAVIASRVFKKRYGYAT